MKILLANKYYYYRGGDCIYTINLAQLLRAHGHEVGIFAMQYPENLFTEWNKYFPREVKFKLGIDAIPAVLRPFGTADVKNKFNAILNDFNPDVVHLNNIHSQLSPVIAKLAHERNIRVIWTIHDCKLVCPRYDCMRDGKRCELCFDNAIFCLKYRCLKGSFIASLLGYFEAKKWSVRALEKNTDIFLCPSNYMAKTMTLGHFDSRKIKVLCNFIDIAKVINPDYRKENYYCYIGRLSPEKGIMTLLYVASRLPYKIKIIGGGQLESVLRLKYESFSNIEFLGQQSWTQLRPVLEHAMFSVLPSECAENNPLSIIESHCLGTPVLGARIGGIPELIDENKNGMTFNSGEIDDLSDKIKKMFDSEFNYRSIASEAQNKYSSDNYYSHLMKLYLNE